MTGFWTDIGHACRAIRRMPALATVVVLSLAAGIGVNTTVFSWLQAIVLQPLPGVAHASHFYLIEPRAETGSNPGASWLEYRDIRERLGTVVDPIAYRMMPLNVGEPSRNERSYGLLVSDNYFSALGLQPALGRFFRPDEVARAGGEPVVVISYGYWQTHFAGAPSALGQSLRVNDRVLTVVGVTPERFQGTILGLNFDLWLPATLTPAVIAGSKELEDRSLRGYAMLAKVPSSAIRERAEAELQRAMRELADLYPTTNAGVSGELLPFWQARRGPQRLLAESLAILQIVMLLLLLAVCANTANLMLARASARQREVGVRLALGAGPTRIVSLFLTESLLLALAGSALGLLLAMWGTNALRAVPFIGAFPIRFQTEVDAIGLIFTVVLGLTCGLIFGLAPAAQLARVDPQAALRSGAQTVARSRVRNALMGAEVAVALVVLMAAALFLRSFAETRETDPGFKREGVLLASYDLTGRSLDSAGARAFATRLLERVRQLPGVESAAIAAQVPLDIHGLAMRTFAVEGRPADERRPDRALNNTVTPGYFQTMGIPFRAGKDFADLSDAAAPPQAVVNEEFARRFIDGEPIGRRVQLRDRWYLITGVVRNSLSDSFGEPATPVLYLSYRDRPMQSGEIHVRTRVGTETLLAPELQRSVREVDPSLPLYDVRTLAEHVEKNLFLRRIPARMFAVLGPLLLVLAAIGIYAVVDFTVSRRTMEIGVRLALGATVGRVVAQIVGESMRVIASGAMAGWLLMFLVALHLLRGVLFLPVFAGVPAILLVVGAIACWVPARRAARLDPIVALRED